MTQPNPRMAAAQRANAERLRARYRDEILAALEADPGLLERQLDALVPGGPTFDLRTIHNVIFRDSE